MIAPAGEECVGADNKRSGLQPDHGLKDHVEVAHGAGMKEMEVQPQFAGCRLEISRLGLGTGKGWVYKPGYGGRPRHKLVQHLQLLLYQLHAQIGHACDVAARSAEAGDKSKRDRVGRSREDNRYRRGRRLCRECRRSTSRGNRPIWFSAQRYSIATFRPSTKPSLLRPWRKAAAMGAYPLDVWPLRNPTTGIGGCCARAASGHAAAAPPSVAKNFRRLMWLAM